jgi:outer membrane protein assembly factor BamA
MKNKFIQLSSLLFLFCSTLAYSNPINKINFIGLNNTSESTLLELIPFEIGQNYSPYASDKIIEALFETELFENISIIKNDNSLNISLKENPNIKYFEIKLINDSAFSNWIKGEKIHFTSEVLDEQIVENKLSTGNVFTKR